MRFLLFAGEEYDSTGGWREFVGSFETIDEALAKSSEVEETRYQERVQWWHIVDLETEKVVKQGMWRTSEWSEGQGRRVPFERWDHDDSAWWDESVDAAA